MLESVLSDPQSDVTEELGTALSPGDGGAVATLNSLRFRQDFANDDAAPRQQRVMPKVQPSVLNRSDQRVPVYWDQTVPVWEGEGGAASTTKRKASAMHVRGLKDRGESRRFESGGVASSSDTALLENSGKNGACSELDGGTWRGEGDDGARNSSSEVSFDAILSIYQSSLVEKSFKCSRRDGWVFGVTLLKPGHDPTRRRLWPRRTFAGCRVISVQPSASRALMGEAGVEHDEAESVRRLRVTIERTPVVTHLRPLAIVRSAAADQFNCATQILSFTGVVGAAISKATTTIGTP